jgi:alkylation response protein AidB-like acyl-CoA dehydrogenase
VTGIKQPETDQAPAQGANDLWYTRTPQQEDMQAAARDFVSRHAPVERLLVHGDGQAGTDNGPLWKLLHEQLGGQAVIIPEEYGGMGLGIEELCALLEETGAQLAFPSLFPTLAQAVPLLLLSADAQAKRTWLGRVEAGNCTATVAYLNHRGQPLSPGVRAQQRGPQWYLDGRAALVLDADTCDVLLVLARAAEGVGLFLVKAGSGGTATHSVDSIDPSRPMSDVSFENVAATPVEFDMPLTAAIERMSDIASVCLAAEQVGGARSCLQMAIGYALQREQFGHPIASFQTIQHMCADAQIALEGARSALYYATWAQAEDAREFPLAASAAKVACSEAFLSAAAMNIQVHGTIGYTLEHKAQLYYRRAKWSQLYGGPPSYHRARIADLLGI